MFRPWGGDFRRLHAAGGRFFPFRILCIRNVSPTACFSSCCKKYAAGDKQQARRSHPACLLYTHKAVPPLWSALHHQLNDLLVRLRHAQSGQPAHVGDGVLHALFHDAVSAKELVAAAVLASPSSPASTAAAILAAQLAMAPSQMMPESMATVLTTVWATVS